MPRKIRKLKADLRQAGFVALPRRGKGSHAIWKHAESGAEVNLAGSDGSDAHHYQEREVRDAIARSRQKGEEERHVPDR
jgi:predicted RNA binding protein YcfA (HicA-like mRNA interferase family)